MGSQRPRSNRSRSPRSPAGGESQGERARLRRNRPLTWRAAFLWLVPLVLLAAGSDFALYAFISDHYARHGHLAVPLEIGGAALGFTALTIYSCVAFRKELRKGSGDRQADKPPEVTAKNRKSKAPP